MAHGTHRGHPRRTPIVAFAVVAGAVALLCAFATPGPADPRRAAIDAPSPALVNDAARSVADWAAVLRGLDRRRGQAWAAGDPAALTRVFAAGSDALTADRRRLRAFARRGLTAHGVRVSFDHIEVLAAGDGRARLRFAGHLRAVLAVDRSGVAHRVRPGRPIRETVTLTRSGPRWLIAAVRHGRAPGQPGQ